MSVLALSDVFAQRSDSLRVALRPKSKSSSRLSYSKNYNSPIKVSGLSYNAAVSGASAKNQKNITVLKIYPNPVVNQININFRLERENSLSIKITDILGNEVMTLTNEKFGAGEYTKTFVIPQKLNTGIYFLRIVAGGEPVIKRISVI